MSDTIDANLVKLQQLYDDADQIAPWAREAVLWANEQGFLKGDGKNFNPKGNLTREQYAVAEFMKAHK